MDHKANWQRVVSRLRRAGTLTVAQFEIGPPVTGDDFETLKLMEKTLPPPAMLQFFKSCNGLKLLWSGTLDRHDVQGSVNILSLVRSATRAPAQEDGEPLEGVLWDEEFEPAVLKRLQRMAIFESIAGRSANLTYVVDDPNAVLYLVEDDRISPIVPDFDTTIGLLERYAGAERLREHLTHSDWQTRIDTDDVLGRIGRSN